jgi:hypothetical protein
VEARDKEEHRVVERVFLAALAIQTVLLLLFRGNVAFALVLVLVAAKFRSDRSWLRVPIIAQGVALLTVFAHTVTTKPGEGPALLQPFLTYRGVPPLLRRRVSPPRTAERRGSVAREPWTRLALRSLGGTLTGSGPRG